ncbi:K+-dependent Na+/Ca+ exchanger [Alkalihalobacillus alcalophilus ATCC 27647 = CGMCC 1.3604]|uniref:K+-dependent Na+/Ca+ exchanger n=2 Tax=Alkalihalobacillus alcalophilus ATCC 27647 = CGMCC 1.3604 TaxID=1218173 RepID=A0A094WHZ5_ALKAL|nr:calcium/sodium antiporter [Alkalihalobacillus alcalophilus]KGA96436.1 sodium:proton exchanger [Alkalihalobacillus alcalophilus ATCC 27647 = CGMCC 1.3604]MED1562866.1 calcium/sodium antiporter [Alkalihalobacillus alcalophilus]THG90128.1 K+-dependent Na+/Ca+ exchanger [Alkalihalobacillus alcalophilus ATCC 27647 = CGMCC 1.3604]
MLDYILLLVGFVVLIGGANYFVNGASTMAKYLSISPLVIGLTIVAFGTSAPEVIISILAALRGSSEMAIGNVVGSNLFNMTFIVGVMAIISPLAVQDNTIRKEIPFTLLASVTLFIFMNDIFLHSGAKNVITRSEGIIFLVLFAVFLYYILEVIRKQRKKERGKQVSIPREEKKWGKAIAISILGLLAILLGGEFVVSSSSAIAIDLGMSETLVGLTIVAIGTSAPELVTAIIAAIKKESDIALGNIVGSGVFNILFVLGVAATITPLTVDPRVILDVIILIFFTLILLIFSRTKHTVGKGEGSILVLMYVIYLIYIIIRN